MKLRFTVETDPPPDRARLISDPLIDFNESQAGDRSVKNFALFAKDASGVVLGGLLGSTHWNHFFVSALFVHARFRKVGIGRELMKRADRVRWAVLRRSYVLTLKVVVVVIQQCLGAPTGRRLRNSLQPFQIGRASCRERVCPYV